MLKFLVFIIAAALFLGYAYEQFDITFSEDFEDDAPTWCPKDTFQCSDGVRVGRTGEGCEFVCP